MTTGFVIIRTRESKGVMEQWQDVLPEGLTESQARRQMIDAWLHLAQSDKKEQTYELVLGAVEDGHLVTEDDECYSEAIGWGLDTIDSYASLLTINAENEEEVLRKVEEEGQ